MFELYRLNKYREWIWYYQSKDIDMIYRTIELCNLEGETISYRIDIEDRVFAFVDSSEYQLDFMRKHYDTNEKCKPRYTSDEYKVKKKGGKR